MTVSAILRATPPQSAVTEPQSAVREWSVVRPTWSSTDDMVRLVPMLPSAGSSVCTKLWSYLESE